MKPICAKCFKFYKPKKNGIAFMEGFGDGTGRPYKLWLGDLWECPNCGSNIIVGTGNVPVAHHFHPDFEELCEKLHARTLIDDC